MAHIHCGQSEHHIHVSSHTNRVECCFCILTKLKELTRKGIINFMCGACLISLTIKIHLKKND